MSKSIKSVKNTSPPRWAKKLLYWFSSDKQVEFLAGDLEELYYERYASKGKIRARFAYFIDVFDMVRPFNIFKNQKRKTTIDM